MEEYADRVVEIIENDCNDIQLEITFGFNRELPAVCLNIICISIHSFIHSFNYEMIMIVGSKGSNRKEDDFLVRRSM